MAVTQKRIPAVKAFCILLIFLVFSSLNVFAGGKKDVENNVTLLEIDRAIWNAEYTDALEMCAMLCNLRPGDEVIVPSYTFVSTALAFIREGAKIGFFSDSLI